MTIETSRLQDVMPLFHKDEIGWFWSEKYVSFSSHVNDASHFAEDNDAGNGVRRLARLLNSATSDLWYLLTICHHANWQKNLALECKLDNMLYSEFMKLDIDAFHTKYRSIFDTIALVIRYISRNPSGFPEKKTKTFTALKEWVKETDRSASIGNDITDLVKSCDWYAGMKNIRDLFIHHNATTMVFPAEKILFQVHKGYDNMITIPEIMFNPYVVDFELYAGLHTGYLLWYLEKLAELGYSTIPLKKYNNQPKSYHPGFGTIKEWMERVLALPPNSASPA